jgi:hypothetical protein
VGIWDRCLEDWRHVEELEGTSRTPDPSILPEGG